MEGSCANGTATTLNHADPPVRIHGPEKCNVLGLRDGTGDARHPRLFIKIAYKSLDVLRAHPAFALALLEYPLLLFSIAENFIHRRGIKSPQGIETIKDRFVIPLQILRDGPLEACGDAP